MSQSSSKSLQFSINETIWLKDGEAAQEILSMALEPDITIEENRSYICIKGGLRLTGEYKPAENDAELPPQSGQLSIRTIDEMTETDAGTALIEHQFPVDITIPAERIQDLEDVFVMIETFDYSMPSHHCIQLEADISITGIIDEMAQPSTYENDNESDNAENEGSYFNHQSPFSEFNQFQSEENEIPFQQDFQFEATRDTDDEPQQQEGPQVEMKRRDEERQDAPSFKEDKSHLSSFNMFPSSNQENKEREESRDERTQDDDILPLRPIFPNIDQITEKNKGESDIHSKNQYDGEEQQEQYEVQRHEETSIKDDDASEEEESAEKPDNIAARKQNHQIDDNQERTEEQGQKEQIKYSIDPYENDTKETTEDPVYEERQEEEISDQEEYEEEKYDEEYEEEDQPKEEISDEISLSRVNNAKDENDEDEGGRLFEKKIKVVPKENKENKDENKKIDKINQKLNKKMNKKINDEENVNKEVNVKGGENIKEEENEEKDNKKLAKIGKKAMKKENKQKYKENKKEDHEKEENEENINEEAENEPKKKLNKREENAFYLTSMLTNEEEQFSKVKMCIVQSGDSIESISERYKVPVTSILRKNNLESDFIDEGQVLYIPIPKKR